MGRACSRRFNALAPLTSPPPDFFFFLFFVILRERELVDGEWVGMKVLQWTLCYAEKVSTRFYFGLYSEDSDTEFVRIHKIIMIVKNQ